MHDPTSILIPLLELLSDGKPHVAWDLEETLRQRFPLNLTCGTESILLDLMIAGQCVEGRYGVFTITPSGLGRLDREREAVMQRSTPAPKQKAMFS